LAEKVNSILTFENVIKLCGGLIAICGLYYALDKRLALMEQKVDYYIALNESKEVEARTELAALKVSDKEISRDIAELRMRIIQICAVLPKSIKIEDEN
jgi:hypothetical protein